MLVGPDTAAEELIGKLRKQDVEGGAAVYLVRGKHCATKDQLFEEWSQVLAFPGCFGSNWDAFDECMDEMLVLNDGGLGSLWDGRAGEQAEVMFVLVSDAMQLLRHEPVEQLRVLLSTLERAALGPGWKGAPSGFLGREMGSEEHLKLASLRVLFQCEPETADDFVSRLQGAGVNPERYAL